MQFLKPPDQRQPARSTTPPLPTHIKNMLRDIERRDSGIETKHLLTLIVAIEWDGTPEAQRDAYLKNAGHVAMDIIGNGCRQLRKEANK